MSRITFTLWFVISLADSARTYTLIVDKKNTYVKLRTVMRGKSTWFASLRRTWHDKCNISRRRERIIEVRKLLKKILSHFDHLRERNAVSQFRSSQGRARYSDPGHRRTCRCRIRIILCSFFSLFPKSLLFFLSLYFSFSFPFFFFFFYSTLGWKRRPGRRRDPDRNRSYD